MFKGIEVGKAVDTIRASMLQNENNDYLGDYNSAYRRGYV